MFCRSISSRPRGGSVRRSCGRSVGMASREECRRGRRELRAPVGCLFTVMSEVIKEGINRAYALPGLSSLRACLGSDVRERRGSMSAPSAPECTLDSGAVAAVNRRQVNKVKTERLDHGDVRLVAPSFFIAFVRWNAAVLSLMRGSRRYPGCLAACTPSQTLELSCREPDGSNRRYRPRARAVNIVSK